MSKWTKEDLKVIEYLDNLEYDWVTEEPEAGVRNDG
jgi:hypothetical protein